MKKQKKDKRRQSTQQLMGIKKITDYCISTDAGDLVFYIIKPTNISVLPAGAVSAKIRALQNTLSAQAGVELLAMNSRESFNATCLFYHDRMQAEQNPAIRELLEQDRAFLDEKQVQMTLARECGSKTKSPTRRTRSCLPLKQNSAITVSPHAAPERKTSSACLLFISNKTPRRSASRTTTVSDSWRRRDEYFQKKKADRRGNRISEILPRHDRAQHREI